LINISDPYICGSSIYGTVSGGTTGRTISIKLFKAGDVNPTYTFVPVVATSGAWVIGLDYNTIISGVYTNIYTVTDASGNTATGQYVIDLKKPSECNTTIVPSTNNNTGTQSIVLSPFVTTNTSSSRSSVSSQTTQTTSQQVAVAPITPQIMPNTLSKDGKSQGLVRSGGEINFVIASLIILTCMTILTLVYIKNKKVLPYKK
jgi:hypothetical protein